MLINNDAIDVGVVSTVIVSPQAGSIDPWYASDWACREKAPW
jgi:hypothetical protein